LSVIDTVFECWVIEGGGWACDFSLYVVGTALTVMGAVDCVKSIG